jgi:phosphatidylglycerol:prolipoprotein diacylglycerol transferase
LIPGPLFGVIYLPLNPIAWQLGPLSIRWYGIAYFVAFLVGLAVVRPYLVSRGISRHVFDSVSFWSIVVGLVGARLYFDVQNNLPYYLSHPQHILAMWEGGMAYFGAVIAVSGFLLLYSWRRRLAFWVLADGAALFAAVGQPIGRIGNVFNGDILGYRSNLPWAIAYTDLHTFAPIRGVGYQPANVYELLVAGAVGGFIVWASRRRWQPGQLYLVYVGLYATTQFLVFFLRAQPVIALGLRQAQWTSLAVLAALLPMLLIWWKTRSLPTEAEPAVEAGAAPVNADPSAVVTLKPGV